MNAIDRITFDPERSEEIDLPFKQKKCPTRITLAGAGMWKDRDDPPDFQELRKGWDRSFA